MWEAERNPKEDKEFITFIAQVEGLSAVPDGRIYMNAYIDTVKGEQPADASAHESPTDVLQSRRVKEAEGGDRPWIWNKSWP